MKESVLISGGSGLVGHVLTDLLIEKGYKVGHISRSSSGDARVETIVWDLKKKTIDIEKVKKYDYLINLVGAGIADKKWTAERKKEIVNSRVDALNFLFEITKNNGINFKSIVSASAVGFYGFEISEHIYEETDQPGSDFLAETCVKWEKAAFQFSTLSIPISTVRIGIVLSTEGGALKELARPIKLYAGAPLGSGKQYIPWVHIHDVSSQFIFQMESKLTGNYNGCADEHRTNAEFTKDVANVLKKPLILPNVPAFVMKIILGERAMMVLKGSPISNKKIKAAGFKYKFNRLEEALRELYS
jgi:hypothetical protein